MMLCTYAGLGAADEASAWLAGGDKNGGEDEGCDCELGNSTWHFMKKNKNKKE